MSKTLLVSWVGLVLGFGLSGGCNHTGSQSGTTGTPGSAGNSGTGGGGAGAGAASGAGGSGPGNAGNTGSGGSGGSTTPSNDLVDNLDDGDGRIMVTGGRQGPWHSFNDTNGGNQQPPVGAGFLPVAGGANGTPYAVHTTGSGYQFGGVGFDLNNATTTPESSQSQSYNASAYSGLTFWAKGNATLRVEFSMSSFVPTDRGGTCTANCWNVYGASTPPLTSDWQQYTIDFSSMQREQGGTSPSFDPSQLMDVSFKAGSSFDFWIDEVAFVRSGGTGAGGGGGATGAGGTGGSSVVHPPPITSGGTNGWGSRYWDCCKPSCGWSANVGGRQPAMSCGPQNMSVSANDQSACSGGDAFMCWNESPWAADDTLAYGFAAHNGVPCGRCYQLQFTGGASHGNASTTGPLNGKTMIVQVTNIGGIDSNQFDLLIPGGGVGSAGSGACLTQFGQNADLGAASGGFLASCNDNKSCVQTRCQTLFADKPDLLAGCNWFVTWFNGADNPDFVYKQIACPAAITQRSGLSDPG